MYVKASFTTGAGVKDRLQAIGINTDRLGHVSITIPPEHERKFAYKAGCPEFEGRLALRDDSLFDEGVVHLVAKAAIFCGPDHPARRAMGTAAPRIRFAGPYYRDGDYSFVVETWDGFVHVFDYERFKKAKRQFIDALHKASK